MFNNFNINFLMENNIIKFRNIKLMKILHIITGLGKGGAENTLYKVCKYDVKNQHIVISLTNGGEYFSLIKKIRCSGLLYSNKIFLYFQVFVFDKVN